MTLTSLQQAVNQPMERMPGFGPGKVMTQAKEDFAKLSESLTNGDTAGAQSTFADLKKVLQSAGSIASASSVQNDFASLGKNLGIGDVSSAQQDLSRLQSDLKAAGQGHGIISGLPTRLPGGGNLYSAGLSAVKSVGRLLA